MDPKIIIRQDATGINIDWYSRLEAGGSNSHCRHSVVKALNYHKEVRVEPAQVTFSTFGGYHSPAQARADIVEREAICAVAKRLDERIKTKADFLAISPDDMDAIVEPLRKPGVATGWTLLGGTKC